MGSTDKPGPQLDNLVWKPVGRSEFEVSNKRLGTGSFSSVWLGRSLPAEGRPARSVAIKRINRGKLLLHQKHGDNLAREVALMQQLRHPNLVELLHYENAGAAQEPIYLVLEHCDGGDLRDHLRQLGRPLSEPEARHLLAQLASALAFLRDHRVVHRDLKPQNLLLQLPGLVLKLADFGFAKHLRDDEMAATICGSPLYMAPEVFRGSKYSAAADLWSVGVLAYEMLVGRVPFAAESIGALVLKVSDPGAPAQLWQSSAVADRNLSPACVDFLRGLLRANPEDRTSFAKFAKHPFLARPPPPFRSVLRPLAPEGHAAPTGKPVSLLVEGALQDRLAEMGSAQPPPQPVARDNPREQKLVARATAACDCARSLWTRPLDKVATGDLETACGVYCVALATLASLHPCEALQPRSAKLFCETLQLVRELTAVLSRRDRQPSKSAASHLLDCALGWASAGAADELAPSGAQRALVSYSRAHMLLEQVLKELQTRGAAADRRASLLRLQASLSRRIAHTAMALHDGAAPSP